MLEFMPSTTNNTNWEPVLGAHTDNYNLRVLKKQNKKDLLVKEPPPCGPKSIWFLLDRYSRSNLPPLLFSSYSSFYPQCFSSDSPPLGSQTETQPVPQIASLHCLPPCWLSSTKFWQWRCGPRRVTVSRIWHICSSSAASFLLHLRLKVHRVTDVRETSASQISCISYMWRALSVTNTL